MRLLINVRERFPNNSEQRLAFHSNSDVAGHMLCMAVDEATSSIKRVYPKADVILKGSLFEEIIPIRKKNILF